MCYKNNLGGNQFGALRDLVFGVRSRVAVSTVLVGRSRVVSPLMLCVWK